MLVAQKEKVSVKFCEVGFVCVPPTGRLSSISWAPETRLTLAKSAEPKKMLAFLDLLTKESVVILFIRDVSTLDYGKKIENQFLKLERCSVKTEGRAGKQQRKPGKGNLDWDPHWVRDQDLAVHSPLGKTLPLREFLLTCQIGN